MSSAQLKKATKFAVKRATQRKKTSKGQKDSQARADAEKAEGQVLVLNKHEIRGMLSKEFNVVLNVKQMNSMFKKIDKLLTTKQKNIKWTSAEDKKWASNPKNLDVFKEKPGDEVWVVSGFESAKTSKFKTANKGNDVASIISKFIKQETGKEIKASDISAKMQLGHGERGVAASEFGLIRAVEEAAEEYNLSAYEKRKLKKVIIAQREKHNLETKVNHNQVWDARKGTFKKNFRFILSYQDAKMNADDALKEKNAFTDTLQEWDIIGTKTSTDTLEGFENFFFHSVKPKTKSKKVRTSRTTREKIQEKSSAKVVSKQKETSHKKYSVARGLDIATLKQAGVRRKTPKKGVGSTPVQLVALINKKLPETVRKNMGAPALENRSGRFANSVKVHDVIRTKQDFLSFGYNYDKNPYQVFEVGSSGNWSSTQRDPRRLIDRSIREVAAEFALGRFYTRRL